MGRLAAIYDRQFCHHRAAGAALPWTEINASLMAATVLSHAGDRPCQSCPLCFGVDYSREECALASQQTLSLRPVNESSPPTSRVVRRPTPYSAGNDNICRRFNRGHCGSNPCKFENTCSNCFRLGHLQHSVKNPEGSPGDSPEICSGPRDSTPETRSARAEKNLASHMVVTRADPATS